ncbi:MAG: hypothetical protein ACTSXL_00290 [Alphaproteobacteria bacterium]|nr:MAG: hypothetical protein B6I23_01575 [Rickettsiaceae bacterium 4572_127]
MTATNNIEYALLILKPEFLLKLSKKNQAEFLRKLYLILEKNKILVQGTKNYPTGISQTQAEIHSKKNDLWKLEKGNDNLTTYPSLKKKYSPEEIGNAIEKELISYFQNKHILCMVVKGIDAQQNLKNELNGLREEYLPKLESSKETDDFTKATQPFLTIIHRTDKKDGPFQAALEIINLMPEFAYSNADFRNYVIDLYFETKTEIPLIIESFMENILTEKLDALGYDVVK